MTNGEFRVSTTSPSQWGRVLTIEVPRARMDAVRSEVVRDLRRKISRPGFRPGKVPAAIVERDFADRIESPTLERFLPEVCDEAIQSESLEVISTPKIQSLVLDDPETVKFEVALDVRPVIELQPLDGLRGQRWTTPLGDEHIARTLEDVREQNATFEDVDREARDGDYAYVTYVPLDDQGAERTDQKVENYPIQLGSGNVVAGFESAVRGLRGGDSARAEVEYPADHSDAGLAGKTVSFQLTLQSVKEKRLPALDDDLARDLGIESLETLRSQIRTDLEKRVSDESERDLRESLVDSLLQANAFEAPSSMVDHYLEAAMSEWDGNARRAGVEPDDARRQEFAQAMRPSAERAVKRALALESLARANGLHVSEEDVDRWIEDRVQAGGSGGPDVRKFFADVRRRRRLRGELTDEKVFEFLKGKAEITEVSRPATEPQAG
jgi:trigger factor